MNRASILKLQTIVCVLSLVIISACEQASLVTPTLTLTAVPTASPINTVTPNPTNTNTPILTPTEAVKEFQQCNADHWTECFIPLEDLSDNGSYYKWLESVWHPDLPSPDPNKHVINLNQNGVMLFLNATNRRNAMSVADRPYATGFTYGYTKCGVTWGGVSHEMTCVVVPIAMAVPGKPGETKIIMGLIEQGYNEPDFDVADIMKALQGDHVLMLAGYKLDQGLVVVEGGDTFDLMQKNLVNYPDIMDRINRFQQTLDPSSISEPGLFFKVFALG